MSECHCYYGAFAGGDPRDFCPDSPRDGTSHEEWDAWVHDCQIYDEWESHRPIFGSPTSPGGEPPAHQWEAGTHFSMRKYGLGLNVCEECALPRDRAMAWKRWQEGHGPTDVPPPNPSPEHQ